MLLLVGLGNPGPKYALNRHNIGFLAADAIAERHGFGPPRARFQSQAREGLLGGVKTLALKPMTYMNESGRSVGEAARFFRIDPAHIVVLHDELDLAPAKIRLKTGGGHGGHNGLRSIQAHLGTPDFRRVRLGIGHPGRKEAVHGYVLSDFSKAEAEWVAPLLDAVADHAPLLAEGEDASFANKVHLDLQRAEITPASPALTRNS